MGWDALTTGLSCDSQVMGLTNGRGNGKDVAQKSEKKVPLRADYMISVQGKNLLTLE